MTYYTLHIYQFYRRHLNGYLFGDTPLRPLRLRQAHTDDMRAMLEALNG